MKKLAAALMALILIFSLATPVIAEIPAISSQAAILIDPRTGSILFEQNAHERLSPASTTKIMTAILAIELGNLDDLVTVNESALYGFPPLASLLGLMVDEEISLRDLCRAIMLMSGNDAANVIAEHIAGDIPTFVEMMNARAAELGAHNTNFVNPTGLHDYEHLSTVYDMAIISRFAMTIPEFRGIVVNAHLYLDSTNLHEERRYIVNTNHMISRMRTTAYYFAPAIGIKTGFTSQAGFCLAAAAGRGRPFELISIVFGAEMVDGRHQSFVDTRSLFDFGYSHFRQLHLTRFGQILDEIPIRYARGTNSLSLVASEPLTVLIPNSAEVGNIERRAVLPDYIIAPIERGQKIGQMEFIYNDNVIGRVDLVSNSSEVRQTFWFIPMSFNFIRSFLVVRIIGYVLLAALILFMIIFGLGLRNAIRKSKRRERYISRR